VAGLALPPGYGSNSWDETTWAAAMAAQLPRFRVASSASWKPSTAAADRTIALAPGAGWGCGVWDRTEAVETIQFPPNNGGSNRFDLLVARWNWQTHTRTFETILGSGTPPLINATTILDSAKVNRIPGTRYDAIVAVVRVRPGVGSFASTDLFDVRVWGHDQLIAPQTTYAEYIDAVNGQALSIDGTLLRYVRNGGAWQNLLHGVELFTDADAPIPPNYPSPTAFPTGSAIGGDPEGYGQTGSGDQVKIPNGLGGVYDIAWGGGIQGVPAGRPGWVRGGSGARPPPHPARQRLRRGQRRRLHHDAARSRRHRPLQGVGWRLPRGQRHRG
jgi:hypothetical protein